MNTLGWLFILFAIIITRQVFKGRVYQLGQDISDLFIAMTSGDAKALDEVLKREGDGTKATQAIDVLAEGIGTAVGGVAAGIPQVAGSLTDQVNKEVGTKLEGVQRDINRDIALWAISLGTQAKGYRFLATGPDYYDCSGLIYRAVQKARGYKGPRFTTATVSLRKEFKRLPDPSLGVSNVTSGDIVVWPGEHMGVVTTPGRFYSARSVTSGIREANIQGFIKGRNPIYLRYTE